MDDSTLHGVLRKRRIRQIMERLLNDDRPLSPLTRDTAKLWRDSRGADVTRIVVTSPEEFILAMYNNPSKNVYIDIRGHISTRRLDYMVFKNISGKRVIHFHTYHVSDTDTLDRIDYRYVNKQLDSQMLQATQFNPTRGEYVYYQCPVMYFENCSNIEFVNLSQLYVDTSLRPPNFDHKGYKKSNQITITCLKSERLNSEFQIIRHGALASTYGLEKKITEALEYEQYANDVFMRENMIISHNLHHVESTCMALMEDIIENNSLVKSDICSMNINKRRATIVANRSTVRLFNCNMPRNFMVACDSVIHAVSSHIDQIIALRTETHVNMACSITDLILCEHENALLVDDHAVVQNRFNYYRTGGETKGEQSGGYTLHITKRNLEFDKDATRAENTFRTKIHEAYGTPEPAWPMPILRQPNAAAAAIAAADQIEIIKHVLSKV